jgi:quinol monooxygenase YgiN
VPESAGLEIHHVIHVIVRVELHEGRRSDFLEEFQRVVPLVLEETGCLAYGPAIDADTDIEGQATSGDDVVTIVEAWQSLDHLNDHLVAQHMVDYRPRVKPMIRQATLQILQPA